MREPADRRERGYTLIEALVAVAIIGMISLVVVPNFATMYRSGRVKSSVRNFTTDLRAARQIAVSEQQRAMISFPSGTETSTTYSLWRGIRQPDGTYNWGTAPLWTKQLETTIFFRTTTFTDTVDLPSGAGLKDIVFRENGAVDSNAVQTLVVQSPNTGPKSRFRISVWPSGQLKAEDF